MTFKIHKWQFISLTIIAALFFSSHQIYAGAWLQKKGGSYYKIDFRYLSGDKIYNNEGNKIPIPKFTDLTIGMFASYGFTNDLTGFINVAPFRSANIDTSSFINGSGTSVKGFGDLSFGIKYGLIKTGNTIISAKILAGIPTAKSLPDGGLWLGRNDFNQSAGIEAGHSFYPAPVYLTEGLTFTNRAKGFSDELSYMIESGYKFSNKFSLIVRFHGQVSLKNGDSDVKGGFGVFSNNQHYIAYNAELLYKLTDNIGIKAYYESGTKGKNIISAPVINAGIFFTY
jgi:hypothetical protein